MLYTFEAEGDGNSRLPSLAICLQLFHDRSLVAAQVVYFRDCNGNAAANQYLLHCRYCRVAVIKKTADLLQLAAHSHFRVFYIFNVEPTMLPQEGCAKNSTRAS